MGNEPLCVIGTFRPKFLHDWAGALMARALSHCLTRYDKHAFPIPDAEAKDWIAVDDRSGKEVDLPRPVFALRLWNAKQQRYDRTVTAMPVM